MNVILVEKGDELYVFYYDDATASVAALLETAVTFAGSPDLSFAWDDAVQLCEAQRRLEATSQTLRDALGGD
jgi:hypothetical protein